MRLCFTAMTFTTNNLLHRTDPSNEAMRDSTKAIVNSDVIKLNDGLSTSDIGHFLVLVQFHLDAWQEKTREKKERKKERKKDKRN
jgi:hypothetical protein